ncbi:hypothetical protein NC651_000354 [Populus alba x Populus x berolinensis]|nr:hypothetical protein NC651_000354 [Populus alba x Populus x berolinensis]
MFSELTAPERLNQLETSYTVMNHNSTVEDSIP